MSKPWINMFIYCKSKIISPQDFMPRQTIRYGRGDVSGSSRGGVGTGEWILFHTFKILYKQ